MNARDCDPFADDDITQEEFEQAAAMITIENPIEADKKVRAAFPGAVYVRAVFAEYSGKAQWAVTAAFPGCKSEDDARGLGETVDEAIAAALVKHAANDPIAKLAKQAAEAGYSLTPIPKHIPAP